MPTVPEDAAALSPGRLHQVRSIAESFGVDARRYDRARPRYPDTLVARIVSTAPGRRVLDVGCGTGIAARQFAAAGCAVLGIEPDDRMAGFARSTGVAVDVATFEAWDPAGRTFDIVAAGQSWHWVDPDAGARKAADVLGPGGRLAIFGHVFEPPPEVAEPFAAAVRDAAPGAPFRDRPARLPLERYRALYSGVGESIARTGRFGVPELWQFDWQQLYARDQWLELLPTTGGLTQLRADEVRHILDVVGRAIDDLGGRFTMQYTTLATVASRTDRS